MMRTLSIATMVALALSLTGSTTYAQDWLKAGPYLQELSSDGVTVVFENSIPSFSWVEVRLKDGAPTGIPYYEDRDGQHQIYSEVQAPKVAAPVQNFAVRVDGLRSDVEYEYRVCTQQVISFKSYSCVRGETQTGDWHTFRTSSPDATEHHLVVVSDMHRRPEVLEQTLKALDYQSADRIIYAGDMMNNMQLTANTVMPVEEPYASFLNKSVELFASEKPFYMLRGESETRGDISRHFRDYFPTRSGRLYNAYRWGDLMVVMLDGGESKADGSPTARVTNLGMFDQYREQEARWLEALIKTEEYQTAKYRIVFSHFPVTNETLDDTEAGAAHFAQVMLPVLNRGNVDLLVAGHRHPESHTMIAKGSRGNEFPVLVQGYNFGARVDIVDENISVKTAGEGVKTKVKKLKR